MNLRYFTLFLLMTVQLAQLTCFPTNLLINTENYFEEEADPEEYDIFPEEMDDNFEEEEEENDSFMHGFL